LPSRPDQFGGEKGNITGPTADIKDAHAGPNAGLDEELHRDGVDELRLKAQSFQLSIRVAENIGACSAIGFDHVYIHRLVASQFVLENVWQISDGVRLLDHAARSMI
jgi:hypothetical protein